MRALAPGLHRAREDGAARDVSLIHYAEPSVFGVLGGSVYLELGGKRFERAHRMKETDDDIEELQKLITQSIELAGDFLRSSFQMPKRSLSG